MHPLDANIESSFHHAEQQKKRRSSLDNSALSAEESFMSLVPDIKEYGTSSRRRRYSLNSSDNKATTFLAELVPARDKKELDLDYHKSGHSNGPARRCGGRYSSRHSNNNNNKLEDGTGDTQNTSLVDSMDLSESSIESSSGTFCDAEEGEPANRAYLQKDLGASCFWDGDFSESDDDAIGMSPPKSLPPSSNERNQRIKAALNRVRKSKEEKGNSTPQQGTK